MPVATYDNETRHTCSLSALSMSLNLAMDLQGTFLALWCAELTLR